ncbi:YbjQ family protein [Methanohalophilus halophilus]|uniref:UPF0145 protein BHR79_00035 n=1 Tax=Methanohalophilus halophilus TaxID=2177 RepID=A0A1L3PZH5_9EURY|nr:YbjQ family protein [Methanohalophilus halophilus]APH38024.1 hypothetical protein BHR79_00035 [Methanohalophilus halophilus]RNI07310.1 hypothetical protein EFE40_10270 [Methanohalophilus halophilus]SDW86134.1 Uncharacterized conserved protein YbjQ, UPF0145 family [Methanohalophilus halophilus]
MIITTTENVDGKQQKILGIVMGNTVQSRHISSDIGAALKKVVGGKLKGYSKMLKTSRDEAMQRMIEEAEKLDADAIVNVRFTTSQTMASAAEILAYGTAMKFT